MTKGEAREYVKGIKRGLSETFIEEKSRIITDKLVNMKEFVEAQVCFTYVNYNEEVVTTEFINRAIDMGKKVYVPKVYGKDMHFHRIYGLADLKPGRFSIPEPEGGADESGLYGDEDMDEGVFVVMPGLCFDENLNRVGYGGGYYDRYFEKRPRAFKAAVAFDCQVVENLVTEEYDLKVDCIVTDKRIIV